jgi:hypothetical protein
VITRNKHANFESITFSINKKFKDEALKVSIFKAIINSEERFDYENVEFYAFVMFREFMTFYNTVLGNLECKMFYNPPKKIVKVKKLDIIGVDRLWQMFLKSNMDKQTIIEVARYIKDLYFRTCPI